MSLFRGALSDTKSVLIGALSLVLLGCGGGSSAPAPVAQPAPPPPPPPPVSSTPDLTQNKLLTDTELVTRALSPQPVVQQDYANWLTDHHYPIRSVTYDEDFTDLEFLSGLIGDKTIVQLGESSHGTAEFNHIKTRIIKYLHQNMGFNVIGFESGFFEGFYVDQRRESASVDQMMRFTFPVWYTNEVFELFQYVQTTQSGNAPLRLMGFDTQISASYYQFMGDFIQTLPSSPIFTEEHKSDLQNALERFRQNQIDFGSQTCSSQASAACDDIITRLNTIKSELETIERDISNVSDPSQDMKVLFISIFAAKGQIDNSVATYSGNLLNNVRDTNMAALVGQIRTNIFPNEKMILWAHNRHITHEESPAELRSGQVFLFSEPMGYHLHKDFEDDLFTIGLYMVRGMTAGNGGSALSVVRPLDNSLEALAHSVLKAALYIDTSKEQPREAGNAFLFERIPAYYWGGSFGSYTMIPSDQYDGIIVIDNSSLPSYR